MAKQCNAEWENALERPDNAVLRRKTPTFNLIITSGIVSGRTAAQGDCMRRHVKKLVFAAGILFGLGATGVASAADMAVKAPPHPAPPPYNWERCPPVGERRRRRGLEVYSGGNDGAKLPR